MGIDFRGIYGSRIINEKTGEEKLMMNFDLCGNSAALRSYENIQAQAMPQREPSEREIAHQMEKLVADKLLNSNDDETINAFIEAKDAWRDFAASGVEDRYQNAFQMTAAEWQHEVVSAFLFKRAMLKVFKASMQSVAEENARKELE